MEPQTLHQRLSQISTLWSLVLQATQGPEAATSAQEQLLKRYGGAVYRYLLAVVRDPNLADDLAQEFALRFVRGDYRRVDPQRGRFRNFVKTVVLNLVTDHRRRQKVRPPLLPPDAPEPAIKADATEEQDRQFLDCWRHELLTRAWEALAAHEKQADQPLYTVLRFRADHPDLRAAQLAEQLSVPLDKPVTDNWVRQVLYRARKLFADFLLDDLVQSLENPSLAQVEEELLDLGLLEYCRPALERRKKRDI
jgi:RNA polymerase sigma-70 factor (ECF subfamily)